ncbi:WbqC family protein [Maribacter sp. 1_2014MBL_MicDiv]|uniref:WbqC family protein n=1 Tax=Maribacter sp. 1_2014MBL_MicDiv TaxID=1644130 RepID=UPI0008F520D9|nr:WbqC family protein [Maribacter sp. 1_2014MBL_MicDiv]APA65437.1 WbqC-like protein [Maribacter sp. 1_2014MBL_MicDiv]
MKVIHPSYFPNILTFSYVLHEPTCWEVHDNYQKQTFRNRTYISNDRGKHILSIPIIHVGKEQGRQKYKDVLIDNSYPWQRQHWRTLQTAYRTSPFFEFYEDEIKQLYDQPYDKLLDYNLKTIETIFECLQMEMPKESTKEFEVSLSEHEDFRFLINAKLKHNLTIEPYTQVFGDRHGFIPNLSILDLLFNMGPNSIEYLRKDFIYKDNA